MPDIAPDILKRLHRQPSEPTVTVRRTKRARKVPVAASTAAAGA